MEKHELTLLVKARLSNTSKKGLAKISVMLTLKGKETECHVGHIMPPDHWDDVKKRCGESYPDHKTVNDQIDEALNLLNAHYLVLLASKEYVSVFEIKQAYTDAKNKKRRGFAEHDDGSEEKSNTTLLEIADRFIKDFEEMVKEGKRSKETLKQWNSTREKIVEFAQYYFKKDDIKITSIPKKFGDEFYKYLTLRRTDFCKNLKGKRRKENVQEVCARKQLKGIKQLLGIAVSDQIIDKNPLENFKTSGGDIEVIPLELHEVNLIHRKKITIPRLDEVRDLFIFQCFTGFAYKDINELTRDHITYVGINGDPWLMKKRGKTDVNEMVPLLPIVLEIIEKYKDHPYCVANNKLIPVDSNANYNGYLKELAVICGVNRVLKTHLARHTFADIMLNVCDFPLEDVSKMLGHKSIRTTARYCRVRKERIARRMKEAYNRLFDKFGNLKMSSVA